MTEAPVPATNADPAEPIRLTVTPVAVVSTYAELVDALRFQADLLNISRETIDEIGGFADRHAGKILAGLKNLGPVSLGLMLNALCLRLIVVENPEAREKMSGRLVQKERAACRPTKGPEVDEAQAAALLQLARREWSRRGGVRSQKAMTAAERSEAARRASRARWDRRKQCEGSK